MKEIEVKVLEVDKSNVIKMLISMGAKKKFEGKMTANFYDFEDGRLKTENKSLRLRTAGNNTILTLKKKISLNGAKVMDEFEVSVDNIKTIEKILNGLGLKKKMRYKKHRESYSIGKTNFEFDTFQGIPTFLEIESKTVKELKMFIKKLGISNRNIRPWTGKEVLDYYANNRKLN